MSSNDDGFIEPDIMVSIELQGERRYLIEPDLAGPEYSALGRVTAQWAYLEHALFVRTLVAAGEASQEVPRDAENLSFKRRLSAFRLLVSQNKDVISHASAFLTLADKMANLQDQRHKVTHGIWRYRRGAAKVVVASSFRPRVEFDKPFDLDSIDELGSRIGAVNFQLTYPDGDYLPRGDGTFAFAHRSLQLSKEDRDRLYPEPSIRAYPTTSPRKPKDE